MHVVLISGSHRPGGETHHIAGWFQTQLAQRGHTSHLLNLAEAGLPLWDEGQWGEGPTAKVWEKVWQPHQTELEKAHALIILSPEYGGMVPSALRNVFLLVGEQEVGHKPALIVTTTSSGTNGAYPVTELRGTTIKNNKILYLPEHLIIRHAQEVMKPEVKPEFQKNHDYLVERATWCLDMLEDYAEALTAVRAKGRHTHPKFPFGM